MKYTLTLAASLAVAFALPAEEPTLLVSFNPFTGQSPSPHKVIECTLDGKVLAERADLGEPDDPTDQACARGVVALADGRFAVVSGTFHPTLRFYGADNRLSHEVRVPGWSYAARTGAGRIALDSGGVLFREGVSLGNLVLMADEWTAGAGTATGVVAATFNFDHPGFRFSKSSDAPIDGCVDVSSVHGMAITLADDGRVQLHNYGKATHTIAWFRSANGETATAIAAEERASEAASDNDIVVGTSSGRIMRLVWGPKVSGEYTTPLLTFSEIARFDTSISDIDIRAGFVAIAGLSDATVVVAKPVTFEVVRTFRLAERGELSVAIRPPPGPVKSAGAK